MNACALDYESKTRLVDDINSILDKYRLEKIGIDNLPQLIRGYLYDGMMEGYNISERVIANTWPRIKRGRFYHFTSANAAESIVNSGAVRLYSISKRYNENEIGDFLRIHDFAGYLDEDESGFPLYRKELMDKIFYFSMVSQDIGEKNEEVLWRRFASNGGVRLGLNVVAENPDFRRMVYEKQKGKPLDLLSELSKMTQEKYGIKFLFEGLSRLCAFYLPMDYDDEFEVRMLYKYNNGQGVSILNDGSSTFVEAMLGDYGCIGYKVDIEEITTDAKLCIPEGINVVKRNR